MCSTNTQNKLFQLPVFLLLICVAHPIYSANQNKLHFQSDRDFCAIEEGLSECIEDIELRWNSIVADDYCLYVNNEKSPHKCWNNEDKGILIYSKNLTTNTEFTLIRMNISQPVRAIINVSVGKLQKGFFNQLADTFGKSTKKAVLVVKPLSID